MIDGLSLLPSCNLAGHTGIVVIAKNNQMEKRLMHHDVDQSCYKNILILKCLCKNNIIFR